MAAVRALWGARGLVRALAERDIRSRYKQAVLGVGWALLAPAALAIALTVFVSRVGDIETPDDVPYPLFALVGILVWGFFSAAVSTGGVALLNHRALVTKLPCPREVFPLASLMVAAFDSAIASLASLVFFAASDVRPGWVLIWLPLLIAILVTFTVGVTLLVAAITVYARDVRHALPVLLQAGVFVTPVAFDLSDLSHRVRVLWALVNPLTASIDGLRAVTLTGSTPDAAVMAAGGVGALSALGIGFLVFKRLEAGFADVV